MKTPLNKLLSNQFLIFSFIKEKLEIVNFIRWGYDNDLPVLVNNKFLHSVAHIYYRSVIVEMCTLFSDNRHQSSNFHLIIRPDKKFIKELKFQTITSVKLKLDEANIYFTEEIKDIRDEEISHFRFKDKTAISLNHYFLPELNSLLLIAKDIIHTASEGQVDKNQISDYETRRTGDDIYSLQSLLQEINGFDYSKAWKIGHSEI